MTPKKAANGGGGGGGGSPTKATHAARAAALLSKARAQASSSPAAHARSASAASSSTPSPTKRSTYAISSSFSSSTSSTLEIAMPLTDLLKTLCSKGGLQMRDAMAVAGKLINARANTPSALSHISLIMLQDIGIESEEHRKRTVLAFKGKKAAGLIAPCSSSSSSGAGSAGGTREVGLGPDFGAYGNKRRRIADDDETLSREYGNVTAPPDSRLGGSRRSKIQIEYTFNEILQESLLLGRYAVVNRAPVMTAWATIVLEKLGFSRPEALSLAHCYVNYTSTMRGISLGIISKEERHRSVHLVGSNQPHFELMGVKIPVMQMQDGTYRGISSGEVVAPEKAFDYMRKSMAQTLSSVFGALTLLADSYMEPAPNQMQSGDQTGFENEVNKQSEPTHDLEYGGEYLNSRGYDLYAEFRPCTSGEWGKKGRLWYDKILALRRGHESDMIAWKRKEFKLESDGPAQEDWTEHVERLIQEELEKEQREAKPLKQE
ncbi:uncharacterized protein MEPE_03080 [Melanopsichium pennsylvanicum]|uniref:Uncharacterized protein n=2 Tax=Melanopsichium pennsylvanicum TaxID=63383 RepID=A0AAJ4XM93_9BASI|nr:conserved hypothetical protein [Melanopsichium pennsylvanicum 4]SNX84371.1 uncharacterized protein MEPE_03080 [Melanopsichium pennsylvanicum]